MFVTNDKPTCVNLKGVHGQERLGCNVASLNHCYLQFLLTVIHQNSMESICRYIQITVKMAINIMIVELIARMKELNNIISYLPCSKYCKGLPKETPAIDLAFLELEMCTNILVTLPIELSIVYWASIGQKLPIYLRKLEENLVLC